MVTGVRTQIPDYTEKHPLLCNLGLERKAVPLGKG